MMVEKKLIVWHLLDEHRGSTSLLVTSMPVIGSVETTFNRSYGYINRLMPASLGSAWMRHSFSEGDFTSFLGEPADVNASPATGKKTYDNDSPVNNFALFPSRCNLSRHVPVIYLNKIWNRKTQTGSPRGAFFYQICLFVCFFFLTPIMYLSS